MSKQATKTGKSTSLLEIYSHYVQCFLQSNGYVNYIVYEKIPTLVITISKFHGISKHFPPQRLKHTKSQMQQLCIKYLTECRTDI